MAESDDHLFAGHAPADVRFGVRSARVAALDLERHLVRAAVLRPAQRADGARDAGYRSEPVPADDACREGRRVEFMFA